MENYVPYHLHTHLSNPSSGTGADSVTKVTEYLDRAQEYGMQSFAFSEHGAILNWMKKKEEVEKRGMKYIHANEVYLTEHLDRERGLIRDNYHYMLIAKNYDGVLELNDLTSRSGNKKDGHYYFNPRISMDELMGTSDNILMTSACLASPLWRAKNRGNTQLLNKLLNFFDKNKHRMFFEVQYHEHPEQIAFNKWLYDLSREMSIPLIAGTDTHALNFEHQETRRMLMKAKGVSYGDEDIFDLTFKSFDELCSMFKKQGALNSDVYMEAIHNTNVMADMIEEFTLDKTPKYPKLYDNPVEVFKKQIDEGIVKREINKKEKDEKQVYAQRIREEFEVYKKLDAVDYMLLQKNIIDWCHKNGIYQGPGRGSVNGSEIAYTLGITDMDSIKHNLNFFRFLNPDRVSLPDIDIDFPVSRRQEVIDYIASIKGIHFAEIITFNTIAMKGAIREMGRGLGLGLAIVDEVSKNIEDEEHKYRKMYPELFKYVDIAMGTVVSMGSHPSGFLISPIPLNTNVGLTYTKESKYPVTQVNMKELDANNYIKLDVLGLANIQIVNEACELAGIERLTPDNVDIEDLDVWDSMRESTLGVFQWESDSAFSYIKDLFSKETIKKIRERNPEFKFIDLLSVGNGAIRPAGASYRNALANGEFKDNGHEALNEFLKDTQGFLIFQEQIMRFLTIFCGFTEAESDSVRRGIAKKEGSEQYLPKITEGFVRTMVKEYGENEEHAQEILQAFLKVIADASSYGFSVNHSSPYSFIGYEAAYLRYHYPLEFLTASLNTFEDKIDKTSRIMEYAKTKDIVIKQIKFGKSTGKYNLSKDENAIYKGIGSIKFLNDRIADELYDLSQTNTYGSFLDLYIDIVEKTSVNSKQLDILIRLNFFSEFGKVGHLLEIAEAATSGKNRYSKTHKEATKEKRKALLKEEVKEILSNKPQTIELYDQVLFEKNILGYSTVKKPRTRDSYHIVLEVNTKYTPRITFYHIKTGQEVTMKMYKAKFFQKTADGSKIPQMKEGDIIDILETEQRYKNKKVDGEWQPTDEQETYLVQCKKYVKK